jgi:hypothetical protein
MESALLACLQTEMRITPPENAVDIVSLTKMIVFEIYGKDYEMIKKVLDKFVKQNPSGPFSTDIAILLEKKFFIQMVKKLKMPRSRCCF